MDQPEDLQPRFAILLPARNEEQRIQQTLDSYLRYLEDQCSDTFEVIVVLNGCEDNTVEVVRNATRKNSKVRWVDLAQPGKGRAILAGFNETQAKVVAFCDSDGSTDPSSILSLIQKIEEGDYDCAIGSRWLPDSIVPTPQPFHRRIASRVFNLIVRILFSFSFKDTQCGAKAFNLKAATVIKRNVTSIGYHFDCEVLWRIMQANLRVAEVPITWQDRGGSGIKLGKDSLKMLTSLIRIRFQLSPKGRENL